MVDSCNQHYLDNIWLKLVKKSRLWKLNILLVRVEITTLEILHKESFDISPIFEILLRAVFY